MCLISSVGILGTGGRYHSLLGSTEGPGKLAGHRGPQGWLQERVGRDAHVRDAPRPVGAGVPRAVAHAGVVRPDGLLALLPLEPGRLLLVELVLQQVVDGL